MRLTLVQQLPPELVQKFEKELKRMRTLLNALNAGQYNHRFANPAWKEGEANLTSAGVAIPKMLVELRELTELDIANYKTSVYDMAKRINNKLAK